MRILLADADGEVREQLRQLVEELGDEPVVVDDGEAAWRMQHEQPCAIVVCALSLPQLDGVQLLERIRQHDGPDTYTYVILLTAPSALSDQARIIELAIAAGVDDHLSKPMLRTKILARLAVARRFTALHHGVIERNRLLSEANRRMRRDLAAASNAQKALLPGELPATPGYAVGWRYQPCEECAGDLLGVQPLSADQLGFNIFDVSGHGVAAALLAVQVARVLAAISRTPAAGQPLSPLQVAEGLNQVFHAPSSLCFLTLVYAILDHRRHQVELVSCAHPAVLLSRADGTLVQPELAAHPVGLLPAGQAKFATWSTDLQPGDRLLLYSDGVTEAPGRPDHRAEGELENFGNDRLRVSWSAARHLSLEDALTAVMDAVAEWRGVERLADDITLLAVERLAGRHVIS